MDALMHPQPCLFGLSEGAKATLGRGDLFDRIHAFMFDDPDAAYPFAARLARENGWSRSFADRAIEEYKRFMFLAVVAGHPVTPSDQVDQVWHLHLLYTRSYWDRFCGEVLGRPVDHGPTKGGKQEGSKFEQWYERTLASYRSVFGEPPTDLWPPPEIRFGEDLCYVRVNTARNHVISRARLRRAGGIFLGAVLLLLLAIASRVF
jgi:hypothetical protein